MSALKPATTTNSAIKMLKYSSIKILPQETIEKISAGEAIERPSSVVKELLENSIDAGAKKIIIEIESAGKKLIRVHDDGIGISAEDLPKVFLRHSTSKIENYNDLYKLTTLGFRGEALASISAVSNVTLTSSLKGKPAWQISADFGRITPIFPAPPVRGTTVEVRNLFFNTPARLKFLKSDITEKNHIIKTAQTIAMAYPEIDFLLKVDSKVVFNLSPENQEKRIEETLKTGIFSRMQKFDFKSKSFCIRGYISRVEHSLVSQHIQYLYVNRRAVVCKGISHSVYEAFRNFLSGGCHPAYVIFIDIQPDFVDVNVHPTKREIKFSNESEICQDLFEAVKKALQGTPPPSFYKKLTVNKDEEKTMIKEAIERYELPLKPKERLFVPELTKSPVQYLCDIFGYCLLATDEEALYLIDSHAAAERILYEKYRNTPERYSVQLLIEPLLINLPLDRYEVIKEKLGLLNKTGWLIEPFGDSTLRCSGIPAVLGAVSPYSVIMELLSFIETERVIEEDELIKKACQLAVRGQDRLNFLEAQKLINDLFSCPNYQTCPHGRPTVIKITKTELANRFKR